MFSWWCCARMLAAVLRDVRYFRFYVACVCCVVFRNRRQLLVERGHNSLIVRPFARQVSWPRVFQVLEMPLHECICLGQIRRVNFGQEHQTISHLKFEKSNDFVTW